MYYINIYRIQILLQLGHKTTGNKSLLEPELGGAQFRSRTELYINFEPSNLLWTMYINKSQQKKKHIQCDIVFYRTTTEPNRTGPNRTETQKHRIHSQIPLASKTQIWRSTPFTVYFYRPSSPAATTLQLTRRARFFSSHLTPLVFVNLVVTFGSWWWR